MNHLCHIFLSSKDPEILFGNFIGDMIQPKEIPLLSPQIQKGIELHYFIDHTVDTHAVYKEGIHALRESQKKYAPVVIDIFCDFLLVDHWEIFSVHEYEHFKNSIYQDLLKVNPFPPEHKLHQRVHTMIQNDFLALYAHTDHIPDVFAFLKKRAKFENNFDQAQTDYFKNYSLLKEKFLEVFPEMVRYAHEFLHLV